MGENSENSNIDIIKIAINNFPSFQSNQTNEIKLGLKQCKNKMSECHSFVRINYILYFYQKWTMNFGQNKHGFYKVINRYNYNTARMMDDYQHLIDCHEFDDIYSSLKCECNLNLNRCRMLERNNNHNQDDKNLYFDDNDDEQVIIEQLLDVIHCYFLHSYDLSLLFT